MEPETNKRFGSPTLKVLALLSLALILIFIAWISVRLINVMPDVFSSLASSVESIQQEAEVDDTPDTLLVTSNTTLMNSGESIVISWNTVKSLGSYTFSYDCNDGASLNIAEEDGGLRAIDCDTNYNIGNVSSLTISAESEKQRFENINYTIAFLKTNDTKPRAQGTASFTVINSDIQDLVVIETTDTTEPEETVTEPETPVVETEPEIDDSEETPSNNNNVTTPVYEQEFIYEIPVSNPNGRTDLSVRFLDTGHIVNNKFVTGVIAKNDEGAIQFEVKNLGAKTSADWSFKVSLPTGGYYESKTQAPLKPNERAVLTVGFTTSSDSTHTFRVEVEESTDRNPINDQFTQPITFTR